MLIGKNLQYKLFLIKKSSEQLAIRKKKIEDICMYFMLTG